MPGYFLFGGSDFIMLYQEMITFTLDALMEEGSESYKHLLMGERLGYLSKKYWGNRDLSKPLLNDKFLHPKFLPFRL